MQKFPLLIALFGALSLGGCSSDKSSTVENTAAADDFKTYSASLFNQTTNFRLSDSDGFGFSADGSKILMSSDLSGIYNVYTMAADGTSTSVTKSTDKPYYAQSFFPNDDRIIMEGDQGGNELDHVYVRDLQGNLQDITPGEKVKAAFLGWRAGGDVFYVITNERDASSDDVYAYKTGDLSRELVFENNSLEIGDISDDGNWLALVKNETSANSDVYLADLTKPDIPPRLITEHEGDIAYSVYAFSPDSTKLIYATNEFGEYNQAWTLDLNTGEKSSLIEADWDVSYVFYSPSGKYRVSAINADGLTQLELVNTATNQPVVLKDLPEGELGQFRFNRDESKIAFGLNTDTSPFNIYTADLTTGATTRLTEALPAGIDENHLVTASIVRYPSFDDLAIPGIMYMPKQASADTPVPALVWVHGGPGGQTTKGYSATIQHLVNHGYAVLGANNRGSSGYGKTFFHLDDRNHGEDDLMDIVYARNYLEGLEGIDKDRIGVIGGSYGGYMTVAALTYHPEVFDVGVNIFGVTNWERTLNSIPEWWGSFRDALYDEMGDPATDSERHRRISPLFHAENITKPLYVVQGANDPRVLQVESDEIVAAVKKNGVPVEYVLFPDEGHGFQKRENRITNSDRIVQFLDKYLKSEGETDTK